MNGRYRPGWCWCVVLSVVLSGCGGKAARKGRNPAADSVVVAEVPTPALGEDVEVQEASLRGKDFASAPELQTVYFDYDRSNLEEAARNTLKKNAEWLRDNPDAEIRVDGHCDDRGTSEYNLALGQRRATGVRDYYKALGIPTRRMATISFGEEMPVCKEATEECWQRNRRVETLIRRQ